MGQTRSSNTLPAHSDRHTGHKAAPLFRRHRKVECHGLHRLPPQLVGQRRRINLHGKVPDPLRRRDQDPSRHVLHDLLRLGDIPAFKRDYRRIARLAVRLLLVAAPCREGNDCGKECHNLHPLFHSFHHLTGIRSDGKSRNAPLCRQIYSTSRPFFPAERHFLRTNPSPHHRHRTNRRPLRNRSHTTERRRRQSRRPENEPRKRSACGGLPTLAGRHRQRSAPTKEKREKANGNSAVAESPFSGSG